MKTICLYFEIHQIIHLKRYRFFDIGTDHYYYDDYENERSITDIANRSYIPALNTLIEQLEMHAPQVIEKLQQLNETGCVEFLAEPYSHGLSSLANNDKHEETFARDVKKQADKIEELFGKRPTVARNSSLIYSDDIGAQIAAMGFKGMLTEGAKHVLGWKSPHYVYHCNGMAIHSSLMLISTASPVCPRKSRLSTSSWSFLPWVSLSHSALIFLTSFMHYRLALKLRASTS